MTRAGWITLVIAIGLIVLSVSLFFYLFEKKSVATHFGYSPEARLNDNLAARRFLKRMGIPAENMESLSPNSSLPAHSDVILITTKRLTIGQRTQKVLFDWVKAGGYLIITARSESVFDGIGDLFDKLREDAIDTDEDLMLINLGLQLSRLQLDSDQRKAYQSFAIDFPSAEDFVWVDFDPVLRLEDKDDHFVSLSSDDHGNLLLTRTMGNGHVSVFTDRRVLHNRRIGKKDNALFLWHLVNLHGEPGKVWFVSDDDMPSLPAWLWRYAGELIISLVIMIVFVLYRVSQRFGPVIQVMPPVRRSLLEHIQASGWFLWQHRHYDRLLQGMQHNLKRELALKHPGMQELGSSKLAARLTEFIDMPEAEIQHALGPIDIKSAEEFTKTVRLYEALRKQL
jgi:hypothetical protein